MLLGLVVVAVWLIFRISADTHAPSAMADSSRRSDQTDSSPLGKPRDREHAAMSHASSKSATPNSVLPAPLVDSPNAHRTLNSFQTPPPPVSLPASSKGLMAEFLEHGAIPRARSPIHEFHSAFESEPVDPTWANAAQSQLRLYIDGVTENATAWLDVTSVACHQTLCEVQVVGNFPGNVSPGDPMDWQAYASRMEREQWFRDRYDFPVNAVTRAPDGRYIYLTYFSRRPGTKLQRVAMAR